MFWLKIYIYSGILPHLFYFILMDNQSWIMRIWAAELVVSFEKIFYLLAFSATQF